MALGSNAEHKHEHLWGLNIDNGERRVCLAQPSRAVAAERQAAHPGSSVVVYPDNKTVHALALEAHGGDPKRAFAP